MRAVRVLLLLVALSLAAAGGWAAARLTAPTVPGGVIDSSPIFVPVEFRVVESAVVDRGFVEYGEPRDVFLSATGGQVITWSPSLGAVVGTGDVVLEIDGRPLFMFVGTVPAYRPLARGVAGADVVQFQTAMVDLGLSTTSPTGVFGPEDEIAAARLYLDAGYEPPAERAPQGVTPLLLEWRSLSGGFLTCDDPCGGRIAEIKETLVARYATARSIVPVSEVAFVPRLPRRVDVSPQPGTAAATARLGLSSLELHVASTMIGSSATMLHEGMNAIVDLAGSGLEAEGTITEIRPGTGERSGLWVVTIVLDDAPAEMVGQSVRLRVPISTSSDAVLAVPLGALDVRADGGLVVVVQDPDGSTRVVAVEIGVSGDGFIEVVPIDGELLPGDYVLVGQRGG